jgi:hypothetical protein
MRNARHPSIRCCGGRIGQASDSSGGCDWTCGLTTPLTDDNTAPGGPCAGCIDQGAPTLDLDDTSTLLTVGAIALGVLVVGVGIAFAVDAFPAYAAARGAKAGAAA